MENNFEFGNRAVLSTHYWEKGKPTQKCRLDFLQWKMPRPDRQAYEAHLRQDVEESLLLSEMLEALTPKFLTPSLASELMELEADLNESLSDLTTATTIESVVTDEPLNVVSSFAATNELVKQSPDELKVDVNELGALNATRAFVKITNIDGDTEKAFTLLEARHRACDLLEQTAGRVYLVLRMNVEATTDESYRHLVEALHNRAKFKLGPVHLTLLRAAMGLHYWKETESFLYRGLSLPEVDGHSVSETETITVGNGSYKSVIKGHSERARRLCVLAKAVAHTTKTDTELVRLAAASGGSGERLFVVGPSVPFVGFVGERESQLAIANNVRSTLDTRSPVTVSPSRDNTERFLGDQLREQNLDVAPATGNLVRWLGEASMVENMFQLIVGCQDPFVASL